MLPLSKNDCSLMMEAVNTSETSVTFYKSTRRNVPEDSRLHTRRRENLKSHLKEITSVLCDDVGTPQFKSQNYISLRIGLLYEGHFIF
jgi:hypothetical protein